MSKINYSRLPPVYPLLAPDGTAAAPSYSFASSPTSGVYLAAGAFTLASAGSMALNAGGPTMDFATGSTLRVELGAAYLAPIGVGALDLGVAGNNWKRLYVDYTNTGTVGAVTINKAAGRVNIAAAGTSIVVTNSICTVNAHVFASVSTGDATAQVMNVIPAAGSFTINLRTGATAQTSIDFFIINAD